MNEMRTIRFRLHPGTLTKHRLLLGLSGACRFARNHFIGVLRDEYTAYGECNPRFYSLGTRFTNLRRAYPWLQEHSAGIVRYALKPIETTYKQFWKGKGGLPRFHGKWTHSDTIPLPSGTFKTSGGWLHVQRVGYMRLCGKNPYGAGCKAKSGTVKREGGKWYAYIVHEVPSEMLAKGPRTLSSVGIDRNVGQFATSDGEIRRLPDLSRLERRKRRYQRMMARRQGPCRESGRNPSKRYLRARTLHQRASMKLAHARRNWAHHESRRLADRHTKAVVEALNTRGMTRSAKGTASAPGRNVAAKRGLNRAILGSAWGKLVHCLDYKMLEGVEEVDPAYTSQTCHVCGTIDKASRRSQAVFVCVACGHRDNADINAALNILAASGNGDAITGRGEVRAQAVSGKRQSEAIRVAYYAT